MPETSAGRPARVLVMGGGITGLTAAYRIRQALGDRVEITVVESASTLGGKLRTVDLAGVPTDVGAEAFVLRNPAARTLVEELGLADRLVHPVLSAATVHAGGRTVGLPARTMLGIPAEPALVGDLLSAEGAARVAGETQLPPLKLSADPEAPDVSVGEVLAERMGRELVDRLVEPLLGGVYAGRADLLGLRATMPAVVAQLDRGAGSLTAAAGAVLGPAPATEGTRGPVFGALRGGMAVLVGELQRRADPVVRRGTPARALRPDGRGWWVELGDARAPEVCHADAVLLAVPPPAARRLLAEVAPAASEGYARMAVASMAVVSLALPPETVLPRASGVLLAVGERHDRGPFTAKAFTFTARKWGRAAGQPVLLRASVGRFGEAELLRREDAELVAAVRADLAELTGVTATPVDWTVTRWGGGLPQYGLEHTAAVARIERSVAALPGLAVAGAALHGVGIPACVDTANAAAARVVTHLRESRSVTPAISETQP
jgi:oxygen-dependent protoporphyrinogen oxidase